MDVDVGSEQAVMPVATQTRFAPATFRGVDCAVLAERYVAYRRDKGLDIVIDDPDLIKPASPAAGVEA